MLKEAAWRWSTVKTETCRSINQQIRRNEQQVGVEFYIRNIVARKMHIAPYRSVNENP
jgi:hypothetical protein